MEKQSIHQVFLRAAIECAEKGATAKEIADYLDDATKGMRMNAAFTMQGDDLVSCLKGEFE